MLACQTPLSSTISRSLLKPTCLESVMPSNHVVPFSSCLQSFPVLGSFPVNWFFRSGGQSIGGFSASPSNEYSELISFRVDWLDILAIQESSTAPQCKGIDSLVLSFLYGPTLTSIHDYWKNCSFLKKLCSMWDF